MHWLFVPLHDEDVLVVGERVLYRRRRHWAAVTPEIAQFLAVLFLQGAFMMRTTTGLGPVLLAGALASIATLAPLLRPERWSRRRLAGAALLALWAVGVGLSVGQIGALVLAAFGVRAVVRVLRWAFFQRTYLTDRRVMEVDGFVGSRINSMPLSKVTDVMLHRPALGEVLGYGTFRVESAGQDQALGRLDYLIDPEQFHDLVVASPSWS